MYKTITKLKTLILFLFVFGISIANAQVNIVGWNGSFFSYQSTNNSTYWRNPYANTGIAANNGISYMSTFGGVSPATASDAYGTGNQIIFNENPGTGWENGTGLKGYVFSFSTLNYQTLNFSGKMAGSTSFASFMGARDFKLQYSLDNTSWTDVSGGVFTAGVANSSSISFNTISNIVLPSACDNQSVVHLRVIMTSNFSPTGATASASGQTYVDDFLVTGISMNAAPTNITLSTTLINENVASNSTVGTLSSTDPDAGNTFTYSLVAGAGSTDNASFNISGSNLRITSSPDFETKNSYAIRLRTTDQGSLTYEKQFTVTINNVNETPTDMALSTTFINENVAANSTVGTLSSTDVDAANTFTYTLVAGTGSSDNASFNISGSNLRITASPDYETKSSYNIRLRTTDQGGLSYEEPFTITIIDTNDSPTDISLSATSINENVAANSTAGTLSSTDPDAGNTFTYSLVAGTGSTDNGAFNISGNNLRITASPDFETKSSYAIRVRTTDQGSLTFEKQFTITINNVNEAPTDISLSATAINENVAANSTVGALSTTDADAANTFTYTLVAGTGSTDNASFNISGNNLRITASPDFETKSSYSIRVRTTDQGSLFFEKQFTITINNLAETPATHLKFDGVDDFVSVVTPFTTFTNAISVEFWINPTATLPVGAGFGQGTSGVDNMTNNVWLVHGQGDGTFGFYVNDNGTWRSVISTAMTLNTWQHYSCVADATGVRIYKNGVLNASSAIGISSGIRSNALAQLHIGKDVRYANNAGRNANASFDELRVYNVAITAEQANGRKNCELQGTETGLVGYYKFNQGNDASANPTATTLTNSVSGGANGTLTNFALTGSISNWLAGSPVTTGSVIPSVATVSTPVVYNQGDTATVLTATVGTNGVGLLWYTTATGGTGSTTAPTPSTASVGNTSYWVSSTNANGCESSRTQIVVNVIVANDECSNAISLTVGSSSFNDFPEDVVLTTATNSGAPTPTCGNFQGGDIWYTATIPISGNIVIETNGAGIYDTGLEVYTGTCGTLSLVSCDDNSGNGNYSKIVLLGQTPGTVLRIRVWENFFGISNAQFQVSAYDYIVPATHLNFDGTNDFVVSANAITNNTENQTYQAWFRIPSIPANSDRILQRGMDGVGAGWSVAVDVTPTGKLIAGIEGPTTFITGTTTLVPNTWYQATFVFENNNSLKLYLNGNLEVSTSIGNITLRSSDGKLRVGSGNIASEFFKGDIDEVRVWNIALSQTDIMNTMNCELQGSQTGLVAYYKFNQGNDSVNNSTVTSLLDSSSNANNGTLTGFALTGTISNWRTGSTITTGNTCATLGNSDFDNETRITIYPNPSTGIFNIVSQQNISVEIYDLLGKLVYNQSLANGTNSIDISNVNTGVYLLRVTDANGNSESHKLIKN